MRRDNQKCTDCIHLRLITDKVAREAYHPRTGEFYACHELGWGCDTPGGFAKWFRPKTILENRLPVKRIAKRCFRYTRK